MDGEPAVIECLHQIFNPRHFYMPSHQPPGRGDCRVCLPDAARNPNCTGYIPIRVFTFDTQKYYKIEQMK